MIRLGSIVRYTGPNERLTGQVGSVTWINEFGGATVRWTKTRQMHLIGLDLLEEAVSE